MLAGAAFAKYHAFEQRVAGQAVGLHADPCSWLCLRCRGGRSVWPCNGDYAAAGVVRGWHYGYGGGGNVRAQLHAAVDGGEVFLQKRTPQVGGI